MAEITRFCSINEAARRSGLSRHFVREGAKSGKIPTLKTGCKYLIDYPAMLDKLGTMAANEGGSRDAENQ